MPIAAVILGALLIDLSFRGTEHAFAAQLGKDFGQGTSFLSWAGAIVLLGALGYVPSLDKVSRYGLALVLLVIVLRNGGLFQQLASVITNPPKAIAAVPLSAYKDPSFSGGSSSSSSGSSGSSGSSSGSSGTDVLSGAASGAAAGSVAGPYGAAAGAVIGAASSYFG